MNRTVPATLSLLLLATACGPDLRTGFEETIQVFGQCGSSATGTLQIFGGDEKDSLQIVVFSSSTPTASQIAAMPDGRLRVDFSATGSGPAVYLETGHLVNALLCEPDPSTTKGGQVHRRYHPTRGTLSLRATPRPTGEVDLVATFANVTWRQESGESSRDMRGLTFSSIEIPAAP